MLSPGNLELQIREYKILRDALIDQLMQKEKVIQDQAKIIESLQTRVTQLEDQLKTKDRKKPRQANMDIKQQGTIMVHVF